MLTTPNKPDASINRNRIAGALSTAACYAAAVVMLLLAEATFAAQPVEDLGGAARVVSAEDQSSATTLKIKSFSAQGMGTLTSVTTSGTCFGETCNASKGRCECDVYSGALKAPILGQSTWTVSYTLNDDNVTATGNGGFCLPAEGELVISSAKGAIIAEVSGPECQNFLSGVSTAFIFQFGQAFKIDPALSTGAAAGLNGGGSFSLSTDLNNGFFTTMTANGFSAQ